ncbi:MAG: class I SAM-dependent methyltransferase [Xanthomonadales bacterium]|nr:class I SAM-dependent methyltransferase [Xanthomonadales bacterium]
MPELPLRNCKVCCSDAQKLDSAEHFARLHKLPFCEPDVASLLLDFSSDGVILQDGKIRLRVDFLAGESAHRKKYGGGRGQALARAVGIKPGKPLPTVVDATAGLARDAFVLASLGCSLRMIEQSPIVAALVENAILRAASDPLFQQMRTTGFSLDQGNSIDILAKIADNNPPDTVYLDPMFPHRQKSAAVKKNMQMLQQLLGPSHKNEDEDLLNAARACAVKRVVVKRPKGAPNFADQKPSAVIQTRKTRYDLYIRC